jgi:hypothetical protein
MASSNDRLLALLLAHRAAVQKMQELQRQAVAIELQIRAITKENENGKDSNKDVQN